MNAEIYNESLKLEKEGDWHASHRLIQQHNTKEACWIHAYLHRAEGDLGNAAYWYSRADKPVHTGSLNAEWNELFDFVNADNKH